MSARGLVAVAALLAALTGTTAPAVASRGGQAGGTGVDAVAAEVTLDVTTSGAIASLGPVVDRLTSGPLLPGRRITAVQAGTPPEPSGEVSDALGPVELGSLLVVEAVTAGTDRVENGGLSAEAGVGGGRVDVLGVRALDVGPVVSRVTTHPDEPPTASASVSGLEVFGSPVTLPEGEAVDLSLALSTDQVLEMLEEVAPGISAVTGFLARVASAGGALDVTVRSERASDPTTGAARATGLVAEVSLSLDLSLCVPELRGDGCVGALAVSADARVLDVRLAHSEVQRPVAVESGGTSWWVAVPIVLAVAAALVAVGVRTARRTGSTQQRSH